MQIPKELERFHLEYAKKPVRRRLVMTSEGGPGCGKTDLFYRTAPRPALVIQLDLNDEGIRERCDKDADILFKSVIVPPYIGEHDEKQRRIDMQIYQEVRDLYTPAVTKGYFRSVMIDEGAELYTLVRRSFLRDLGFGGEKQQAYTPVNAAMKRFYTLAKQNRVNLYIPHRQTDERVSSLSASGTKISVPTGGKVAAGWKDSLYESQCHVLLEKDTTFNLASCAECNKTRDRCRCDKFRRRDSLDKFTATIKKCTANTKVEGQVLVGDDINWPMIGTLVFPYSSDSDWE